MTRFQQIIRSCVIGGIIGTFVAGAYIWKMSTPIGHIRAVELYKAKVIYLGLKMYAGDHDGKFPSSLPDGSLITTANQAYRTLIPKYVGTEGMFYIKGSAWTPKEPDEKIEGTQKLAAGENAFAYVLNLTDTSNQSLPLVANAFSERMPGVYSADPTAKGGIPEGGKVVVVRVDGSGVAGNLKDYDANLFKPAPDWLAPNQVPLNPE